MDSGSSFFSEEDKRTDESHSSRFLFDSSLYSYPGGNSLSYSDLKAPDCRLLGSTIADSDPFCFENFHPTGYSGDMHPLVPFDSPLHASREIQRVLQFDEPASLLSSVGSSSSYSHGFETPISRFEMPIPTYYKSSAIMEMGDGVLVMDGVPVKEEKKGCTSRRQSSLISDGNKRELSPGKHRLRHLIGSGSGSSSSFYGSHRKQPGGGSSRSDGRSWKKDNAPQVFKHQVGYQEDEPHRKYQISDDAMSRDGIPPAQAVVTELWTMYLNNLKGRIGAAPSLEEPWSPEVPRFPRKKKPVIGYIGQKMTSSRVPPTSSGSSSSSGSNAPPAASPPLPPPPPPPPTDGLGTSGHQKPDATARPDANWPKLSGEKKSKSSARREQWAQPSEDQKKDSGEDSSSQPPPPQQPPTQRSNDTEGSNFTPSSPGAPTTSELPVEPLTPASVGNSAGTTAAEQELNRTTATPTPPILPTEAKPALQMEHLSICDEEERSRLIWSHRIDELPPPRGGPFDPSVLTEEEERFARAVMYGPSRRRRLPVFEAICPSTSPGSPSKKSASKSKKK